MLVLKAAAMTSAASGGLPNPNDKVGLSNVSFIFFIIFILLFKLKLFDLILFFLFSYTSYLFEKSNT